MSIIPGDPHRHRPPGRLAHQALTGLAAAIMATALAASTVSSGPSALAADTSMSGVASYAAATPASLGVQQNATPGLRSVATTVRLITGQQVQFTRGRDGQYSVTQVPDSMTSSDSLPAAQLVIHGETGPGGSGSTVTATPTYAQQLVSSGAVDPHLFNVTYLAAHGYATHVSVVVHYASTRTAAAVEKDAAALPGASYVAGSATADQATVAVTPDAAATFWSAVTSTPVADPASATGRVWYRNPNAPQVLRDGIAGLSLAGAPAAAAKTAATQPALAQPTYQLTVHIQGFTDPRRWLYSNAAEGYSHSDLLGLAGSVAGKSYYPSTVTCVSGASTCDGVDIVYDVPAGTYQLAAAVFATEDNKFAEVLAYQRVDLDANRQLDFRSDESTWTSLTTPKPSQPFSASFSVNSVLPDGRRFADVGGLSQIGTDFAVGAYVLPGTQTATPATFSFELTEIAAQPPITMSVDKPGNAGITLSPDYPLTFGQPNSVFGSPVYTFPAGSHRYQLVDVGYGSKTDFANRDVAGKLAIMRVSNGTSGFPCSVEIDALRNAINAHVAGVIFDMTRRDGLAWNTGGCYPDPEYDPTKPSVPRPEIPWVSIQASQARALEALVGQQPVTISVDANDEPSYAYVVSTNYENVMPASVARTVTAKDLATQVTTVSPSRDSQRPQQSWLLVAAFNPEQYGAYGNSLYNLRTGAPYQLTEYLGIAPDVELQQFRFTGFYDAGSGINNLNQLYAQWQDSIPFAPTRTTIAYGREPFTFGALPLAEPRLEGLFGETDVCSFCREGNDLVLYGFVVSGASPELDEGGGLLANAQLTSNGVAIPSSRLGFTLPPQTARYQLTAHADTADYAWSFTSAAPTADQAPAPYCLERAFRLSTAPCAPAPLIFIRYAAPVNSANQSPSGTSQTVTVTAYHEGDQAPGITDLTTQVSFDRGTTWVTAKATRTGTAGTYKVTFAVPPLAQTDGYVTLRTTARDADGNTTDQTYYDSYALK